MSYNDEYREFKEKEHKKPGAKYIPPEQEYHFAPVPDGEPKPDDKEGRRRKDDDQAGRARTREIYVTESYLEQREIEAQAEVREVEAFTRKEMGDFGPTLGGRIESAKGMLTRRRERRLERERLEELERKKKEDQKKREKDKLEKKRFTPGRRGKPKPGSIADQIDKALRPIFEKQEEAVTGVTSGMRVRGKTLMGKSRTLATGKIEDFPEYMGVYMSAVGYRFGAGFVEGVTFVARPLAWGKTIQSIITVAQHPGPAVLAAGYELVSDPFGTIAEVGGALTGGYAAGRAIDYTLGKYQRYRQAKFEAGVTTEDFLPFEEQYQYPSEVTLGETEFIGIVEKKSMKVAKVESRLTPMEDYMEIKPPKIEDPTSHPKFDVGLDASEKAKWGRLGEGEATLMPRGTWPKKFDIFKKGGTAVLMEPEMVTTWEPIIHLTTVSEHMPGLRIVDISPTVSRPFTDTARMLGTLGLTKALTDIKAQQAEVTKVKVDTKLETIVTQDIRLVTIQPPIIDTVRKTKITPDTIVTPIPDVIEIPDVIVVPDVTQKTKQRQSVRVRADQKIIQETAYAIPVLSFARARTLPRVRPVYVPRMPKIGAMFGPLKKRGEFRAYPVSLPEKLLKLKVK